MMGFRHATVTRDASVASLTGARSGRVGVVNTNVESSVQAEGSARASMSVADVAGRLEALGCRPTRSGGSLMASCPVPGHDDQRRSLGVTVGRFGDALVTCFTGCTRSAVFAALRAGEVAPTSARLEKPIESEPLPSVSLLLDAWHNMVDVPLPSKAWDRETAMLLGVGWDGAFRVGRGRFTFPCYDAEGRLAQVVGYAPGGEPKTLSLSGRQRLPWPAPERIEGEAVVLVEGEGDGLSGRSAGLPCVALPGASSSLVQLAVRLERFTTVVACFDCDAPGRRFAERAAVELGAHIVDLDPNRDDGFDLTDFIAAGGDVGGLL